MYAGIIVLKCACLKTNRQIGNCQLILRTLMVVVYGGVAKLPDIGKTKKKYNCFCFLAFLIKFMASKLRVVKTHWVNLGKSNHSMHYLMRFEPN